MQIRVTPFLVTLFAAMVLGGSSAAGAQTAKKSNPPASGRSSAWTGTLTYTRSQSQTDHKTTERPSRRGRDTTTWEMTSDYQATIGVFEAPERNGSSSARATITHRRSSVETRVALEKNTCDKGKTWQEMRGTFVSQTNVTGQATAEAIRAEGATKVTSTNATVYDHAATLTSYVTGVRRSLNAWQIDMLAHSTGGLVARLYVHQHMETLRNGQPVIKHLLMLGTPNLGVPCADALTKIDEFRDREQTAKELLGGEIAQFNRQVTQRKGTRFSALVGNAYPILCAMPQWNDGFVAADSARHGIDDVTFTSAKHVDLVSTESFSSYVRAHIIVGPEGTYPLAAAAKK